MSDTEDKTVVSMEDVVRKLASPRSVDIDQNLREESLQMGLNIFEEHLEGCNGFLALVFDENNLPAAIHAGELDIFNTIGALEKIKQELLKSMDVVEDVFEEILDDDS